MITAGVTQAVERGVLVISAMCDERSTLNRLARVAVTERSAGGGRGTLPAPAPRDDDEFVVDWALAVRGPRGGERVR
ncbi:MAG TPA: hypothetical protein VFI42_04015 [Thermomicrobiaceae bacterium]|nr:hypothetical protein [Thermomicrobiaceae bacterium]